jgi:SpoIID/LytB domain protein
MTSGSTSAPFPIIDGKYRMDREPVVRIGVILEQDGNESVSLRLPAGAWRVEADGQPAIVDAKSLGDLTVRATVRGVSLEAGAGRIAGGGVLRLIAPTRIEPTKAGDGALVRGIVAGRGFHWSKRADQTLTGVLEFRASGGRVVLVNELPLEEYLVGVVTSEMSGACPPEFMKAQVVAARSWLLAQPKAPHEGAPFVWCNDDCCQRYQGTGGWSDAAIAAVRACHGEVLITPTNRYCDARYSKNTGGISEDAVNVWGVAMEGLLPMIDAPKGSTVERFFPVTEENLVEYLTGDWLKTTDCFAGPNVCKDDELPRYLGRVDEPGTYFRWRVPVTQETLRDSLTKRAGIEDLVDVLDLRPLRRGYSGRLNLMAVEYRARDGSRKTHHLTSEYDIRAAMRTSFLYSGAFMVADRRDAGEAFAEAVLVGAGWGHGAGLCQIGALGRGLKGQDYREILHAYFAQVRLERIYD